MGKIVWAILGAVWPYAAGLALAGAVVWYIEDKGAGKAERAALEKQVKDLTSQANALTAQIQVERQNVAKAAAAKVTQQKEVSNARKEVDDAYRAGRIPDRVRKFYID